MLAALSLLLVWTLNLGSIQPNRIAPGEGYGLLTALGTNGALLVTIGLLGVMLLALLPLSRRFTWLAAVLTLALAWLPVLLSVFAARHLPDNAPYARTSIGAAFWCLLFLLSLMLIETQDRLGSRRLPRLLLLTAIVCAWSVIFSTGGLVSLSLVREFQTRPEQFFDALGTHLALALGAVTCSLLIACGLTLKMLASPCWQRPILALVGFLQTIPSLALFGLLIAPLSALSNHFPLLQEFGIRGIGWAPAALALVAYSLLPMVRNNYVALTGIAPTLLNAGRGMGMSERQLFFKLKLPLALPVMIEGVRITTVQAIGLTAVAALVGAGGFGTFIFQGLGQAAMDLVLLGAIPTVILALVADAALSLLAGAVKPANQIH